MAHTPGPWTYRGHSDRSPNRIAAADDTVIMDDEEYYQRCSPNDADWPLIAAAPDLLAACKAALNDRMYTDWPGVADLLLAAIAKAEGR